jgi:hypothetical protein
MGGISLLLARRILTCALRREIRLRAFVSVERYANVEIQRVAAPHGPLSRNTTPLTHLCYPLVSHVTTGDSSAAPTKDYCENLVSKLHYVKDLPVSCQQYASVVQTLQSKEQAANDPFHGMWGGAASKARMARSKGQEHHAQIQRRATNLGQRRFSNKEH